jgi:hypothetical protein
MASALQRAWSAEVRSDWVKTPTSIYSSTSERSTMSWTKPEAEVVAVTMEVTAYVATL